MPQFEPSESKAAVMPMTNPTAKLFDYQGVLYMGTDLAIMSQASFQLEAGEQKDIGFPVTMPSIPGTYPVHIGVLVAGENIALYKATEDVVIVAPVINAAIVEGYLRSLSGPASIYYSGWAHVSLNSTDVDLTQIGRYLQAGFIWRNNSSVPVTCNFVIWHRWWRKIDGQEYVTEPPFVLPTTEPSIISPAPTGLPYSGGEYECDKFTPPGSTLGPGQKGFIYTPIFRVSSRWNYIYATLLINGQNMGTWYVGGWGGY